MGMFGWMEGIVWEMGLEVEWGWGFSIGRGGEKVDSENGYWWGVFLGLFGDLGEGSFLGKFIKIYCMKK